MQTEATEFIRDVAAIVDGIPKDRFNLGIYHSDSSSRPCRTVGCVAGFMCRYPDARLNPTLVANRVYYAPSDWRKRVTSRYALPWLMFELPQAGELSKFGDHKRIFAARVVSFLKLHDEKINPEYLSKYNLE